ncbi:NAD-dependent epimerase/dehydratase family protein, partial [Acinetobacter baumannii]
PASIYAATKLAQEDLVRIFSEISSVPAISLRFQNVFGEGQSLNNPYTGILSIFSTRIRRGFSLPIFEDGMESRDFIHVSDIARAIS